MANFSINPRYPDVLLVSGTDVYRRVFHQILADLPGTPVTLETHDFWVINFVNPTGGAVSTSNGGPNRLKKFVNMDMDTMTVSADTAGAYLSTLLHELGHYWLVPRFSVRFGGTDVAVRTTREFINAFFEPREIPSLCLLAKEDSHWTCFMSAGQTTFEAVNFVERETIPLEGVAHEGEEFENILRRYETDPANFISGDVGNFTGVNVYAPYSDLDLMLMGAIGAAQAYPQTGGNFYELVPQWISPIDMMTGICLVFAPNDIIQFGFYEGHEKVSIQRTGSAYEVADISRFYTPSAMWNFDSHLAFRIVKQGNNYHFQFRQEITQIGCLGEIISRLGLYRPPSRVDVLGEQQNIPQPQTSGFSDLDHWITLKTIQEPGVPVAGGYMVKTWGSTPPLVDVKFTELQIGTTAGSRTASSIATGELTGADYLSRIDDNLLFHRPHPGPALIRTPPLAHIILGATVPDGTGNTMEVGNHDSWIGVDKAPKLLTRLPVGDFVMGGKVKIQRSAMAPHAAGAAARKLWAFRRQRSATAILLDQAAQARQANNSPYKCAFMILAPNPEAITEIMISNVDTYRRAAENFFPLATRSQRSISTSLR